ncbi:MAG: flagellar hook protein FlgE [Myxococcales bacterium]|nr:flagellar hook protein FlgE [Myxococcales bacterium]
MSILRSMQIGVAGLRAHSEALGVAGDNIANVNTVGFKAQRGTFQDQLGRSIAGAGSDPTPGAGSRLAHIEQMWTQGALLTTDSPTDLALSGDGFFIVDGTVGGTTGRYFSRAGQFHIDADGQLVNPGGLRLQGYTAQPDGTMGSTLGNLTVTPGTIPANPTTEIQAAVNLDSNAQQPAPFDPTDPAGTSNFSNTVTVYDSLGNGHEITVYYAKNGPNSWEWHAMVDGGDLAGGTPGAPVEGASGTLTFTTDGRLDTESAGASSWDFIDAAPGQVITFDFGSSVTGDLGDGLDGSTQFASPSTTTGLSQDGFAAGSVAGISIGPDGRITGIFNNGQQRAIGQVAVASFGSVEGLARGGQGLWHATEESGQALVGAAETGGRGSVVAGALEQSNVDLGAEFVNLISYQRGFQANSRVITTADEMYGELVNLKR